MMRRLSLPAQGSAESWGQLHGRSFAGEIAALAQLRLSLARSIGGFSSEQEVLAYAEEHLPVLEAFDEDLHAELMGLAEGAGVSPARIVVLNHYTDLRDLAASRKAAAKVEADGCTALWAKTPAGSVLAQTWDMHASAMPFVMMMHLPAGEFSSGAPRPETWVLSLTGCLGMAGANAHGVGVGINNLRSLDARVGVVWSALVRRLLREGSAEQAQAVLGSARIGSGHHYLIADAKQGIGVETSGFKQKQIFRSESGYYHHTNHCLDPEIEACSVAVEGSSSPDRYAKLGESLAATPLKDVEDAWGRLSSVEGWPRSVCTYMASAENPHGMATCATLAMDLKTPALLAVTGLAHGVAPQRFSFGEA